MAGAWSEFANHRYNNCANRCYYASFQAAVFALLKNGIRPAGRNHQWGHDLVQAEFVGQLVNRRKLYPADHRQTLLRNLELRQIADYRDRNVTETQARRALHRTRDLIEAIEVEDEGGEKV